MYAGEVRQLFRRVQSLRVFEALLQKFYREATNADRPSSHDALLRRTVSAICLSTRRSPLPLTLGPLRYVASPELRQPYAIFDGILGWFADKHIDSSI